jgi:hypothetical protein
VWVTGEALVAFSRKSLPIAPVPLKKKAKTAAAPAPVHARVKKVAKSREKRLHGGPIATIARTTPVAATPTSHESRVTSHPSEDQGTDLTWILVGIAAAAVAVALFRGRKRLRALLG